MNIHYELLGSHPEVQCLTAPSSPAELIIYAEHFYGLSMSDFSSVPELVSAIGAAEQSISVR